MGDLQIWVLQDRGMGIFGLENLEILGLGIFGLGDWCITVFED